MRIWPIRIFRRRCGIKVWRNIALALAFALWCAPAQAIDLENTSFRNASSIFLIDYSTGAVLVSKEPDWEFNPGSTVKLMTAYVVFSALRDGEISQNELFTVSEHAWRTGGAPAGVRTMFAPLGSRISVSDLLRGLIIQDANDAAIVLAEGLCGSEAEFIDRMNAAAQKLELSGTSFAGVVGFSTSESRSTLRDLIRLSGAIIDEFPNFYHLYAQPDFTWNKILQRNKNSMLGETPGLDGLTIGGAKALGFNAIGAVSFQGRRLIGGVAGMTSAARRLSAMKRLFAMAQTEFQEVKLYDVDALVASARVFGGDQSRVGLITASPVDVLLPKDDLSNYHIRVVYRGPLFAPIQVGEKAAELRILHDDALIYRAPLYTQDAVSLGAMRSRALNVVIEFFFGRWSD